MFGIGVRSGARGFWRGTDDACGAGYLAHFVVALCGDVSDAADLWDDDVRGECVFRVGAGGAFAARLSGGAVWSIGVVLLFGVFIDLGMWVGGLWVPSAYWGRLAEVVVGSVVMAAGIALQIHADLIFNPGEGIVKALCCVTRTRFAWTKMGFDVSLVAVSLVLSLVALHAVRGLREGTIVAAFAVGLSLRWLVPLLRPVRRWLFA